MKTNLDIYTYDLPLLREVLEHYVATAKKQSSIRCFPTVKSKVQRARELIGKVTLPDCNRPVAIFSDFCGLMDDSPKCKECSHKFGLLDYIE